MQTWCSKKAVVLLHPTQWVGMGPKLAQLSVPVSRHTCFQGGVAWAGVAACGQPQAGVYPRCYWGALFYPVALNLGHEIPASLQGRGLPAVPNMVVPPHREAQR